MTAAAAAWLPETALPPKNGVNFVLAILRPCGILLPRNESARWAARKRIASRAHQGEDDIHNSIRSSRSVK